MKKPRKEKHRKQESDSEFLRSMASLADFWRMGLSELERISEANKSAVDATTWENERELAALLQNGVECFNQTPEFFAEMEGNQLWEKR